MVFGQSVLKRAGLRVVGTGPIAHTAKNVWVNVAGFPFLFHIKKPSALCNFLLWKLTCWNCNASQFCNKLKGLCLFSLLLQASFWRLQIQFCGFLMLVFFFFPKILLKAWDGGGALVLILVLSCQECCSLYAFPPRALGGTLEP